jgi:hypothetical protein
MTSLAAKKFCIKYKVARFYYLFVNGEKKIFRNVFFLLLNIVCFCSTKYEIKNIKNPIIFPLPLLRIQLPLDGTIKICFLTKKIPVIKIFSGN